MFKIFKRQCKAVELISVNNCLFDTNVIARTFLLAGLRWVGDLNPPNPCDFNKSQNTISSGGLISLNVFLNVSLFGKQTNKTKKRTKIHDTNKISVPPGRG